MKKFAFALAIVATALGVYTAVDRHLSLKENQTSATAIEPLTNDMLATAANPSQLKTIDPKIINQLVTDDSSQEIPAAFFTTLPASLKDATAPLPLMVDSQGQLIIDQNIQKMFDFYLTAIGEEPLTAIVSRIKHDLTHQLPPPALAQGMQILEGYLQHRNHVAEIINTANQGASLTESSQPMAAEGQIAALNRLKDLKQQINDSRYLYLDPPVVTAFFEQQMQYDDYMLALKTIDVTPDLTIAEKQQAKLQLQQQNPSWLVAQQNTADQLNQYRQLEQQMKPPSQTEDGGNGSNGSNNSGGIQALREETFGVEAADRLAKLDEKKAIWQQTLSQYRRDLDTLLGTFGNTDNQQGHDDQLKQQIAELRQRYFSPSEQQRVAAIDHHQLGL